MGELVFNAFLLVIFIVFFGLSFSIPVSQGDELGRYWPMGILIILIIMMIFKLIKVWKALPKEKIKVDLSFLKTAPIIRLVLAIVALVIYAYILGKLGYVLSTILFCLAVEFLIGVRSIPKALLASLGITVVLFAVFSWGLDVSLPRGTGVLESFGKWLEYLV